MINVINANSKCLRFEKPFNITNKNQLIDKLNKLICKLLDTIFEIVGSFGLFITLIIYPVIMYVHIVFIYYIHVVCV